MVFLLSGQWLNFLDRTSFQVKAAAALRADDRELLKEQDTVT